MRKLAVLVFVVALLGATAAPAALAQHPKTVKAGIYDTGAYGLYHR